jgi:hypothetical protein
MNVPLILAGSLAILGAAIHGVGGEVLVLRKLSPRIEGRRPAPGHALRAVRRLVESAGQRSFELV